MKKDARIHFTPAERAQERIVYGLPASTNGGVSTRESVVPVAHKGEPTTPRRKRDSDLPMTSDWME